MMIFAEESCELVGLSPAAREAAEETLSTTRFGGRRRISWDGCEFSSGFRLAFTTGNSMSLVYFNAQDGNLWIAKPSAMSRGRGWQVLVA